MIMDLLTSPDGRRLRRALPVCLLALSLGLAMGRAQAGAQQEERLADSVRTLLASQISDAAPPEPTFTTYEERLAYLNWLGDMGERLKRRQPDFQVRQDFLRSVWYEAKRAGLDPSQIGRAHV